MEPFLLDGRPDLTCKDSTTQASYRPRVEAVMALDGACGRSHSDARVGCGELVGANPTDRGKSGSKYHLIVDGAGLPLAALVSAANTHDSRLLVPLVDRVGPVRGRVGRPRRRPARLYADKTSHAVRRQAGAERSLRWGGRRRHVLGRADGFAGNGAGSRAAG